jgi:pyridoxine 5-phosphate synthase
MAATAEMQAIALRHRPHAVCLVPEKREERTTEGGLTWPRDENRLADFIAPLREAGCRVSMFIGHDPARSRPRPGSARGGGTAHRALLRPACRGPLTSPSRAELAALRAGARWPIRWGSRCMRATG